MVVNGEYGIGYNSEWNNRFEINILMVFAMYIINENCILMTKIRSKFLKNKKQKTIRIRLLEVKIPLRDFIDVLDSIIYSWKMNKRVMKRYFFEFT